MQTDGQSGLNDLKSAFDDIEAALVQNDVEALDAATGTLRARLAAFQPDASLVHSHRDTIVAMERATRDLAQRLAERVESYDHLIARAIIATASKEAITATGAVPE